MDAQLGLAETVEALRMELSEAMRLAENERLRFAVGDVELELSVTVSRRAATGARVRFWVVDGEGGGEVAREAVQKLRLTLTPHDTKPPEDAPPQAHRVTAYVEGAVVAGEDVPATRATGVPATGVPPAADCSG